MYRLGQAILDIPRPIKEKLAQSLCIAFIVRNYLAKCLTLTWATFFLITETHKRKGFSKKSEGNRKKL